MGQLKQVDDAQWTSLNIPMGLVNQIKSSLADFNKPKEAPSMQIDSKAGSVKLEEKKVPVLKVNLIETPDS